MVRPTVTPQQLRVAIGAAIRAPSVHNTQPWRFVVSREDGLDTVRVYADLDRRLSVIDPTGRQLWISVGCAVFNLRATLAAWGIPVSVQRLPDGALGGLAARIVAGGSGAAVDNPIAPLEPAIVRRQTNRREFADDPVPAELIDELVDAAAQEDSLLRVVRDEEDRQTLARLSQAADAMQIVDPRYRAEVRAWTTADPHRLDGVPAAAVPHVDGSAATDMPIRDFDSAGLGWLPSAGGAGKPPSLLVLGTESDGPAPWLRAGEALERVWLELTRQGYVASLFTQVIEVPRLRAELREQLRLMMQPHVVIRIGHAPSTAPSLRRHYADVVDDRLGTVQPVHPAHLSAPSDG